MSYLVFRSTRYYPCGARDDFQARVDDADAWIAAHPLQPHSEDWYDVLNVETNEWRTIEYVDPRPPRPPPERRVARVVQMERVDYPRGTK